MTSKSYFITFENQNPFETYRSEFIVEISMPYLFGVVFSMPLPLVIVFGQVLPIAYPRLLRQLFQLSLVGPVGGVGK